MSFDFFDSPELLDIQREAFYRFLNQGIPELLSKQFPIKAKNGNYSIELLLNNKNVKLITPDSNPRDCVLKMKTYSCKLYAQVKIVCKKVSSSSSSSSPLANTKGDPLACKSSICITKGDLLANTEGCARSAQPCKSKICKEYKPKVCSKSNRFVLSVLHQRLLPYGQKPLVTQDTHNLFAPVLDYARVKCMCKTSKKVIASLAPTVIGRRAKGLICKPQHKASNTNYQNNPRGLNENRNIVYESKPEWVLLGQLPMMTKRGHFIINGSPRVIVHQVVRSPGIYFQKLVSKDDRKIARFYGDIIPLKGVWVRLQMTKKGRIEAKFKKGKKVRRAHV